MKLITRNTDYAVRVLRFMARDKKDVFSASALIKKLKIPRPFLRKIMHTLNKKRIVKSSQGVCGGFQLAVSPGRIFLLDLIEIFQGPFEINECIFRKRICREKKCCLLRRKIQSAEKQLALRLKSVNIKSLMQPDKKRR